MVQNNIISSIIFVKNLISRLYGKADYLDMYLDIRFQSYGDYFITVSKCDTGFPFLDFFDVIVFGESHVEIIDYFYSIIDSLMEEKIPVTLFKRIHEDGFWDDVDNVNKLVSKYPGVFKLHLDKSDLVAKTMEQIGYEWLKMENLIEDGFSVTRMRVLYAGSREGTVSRIIEGLWILKSVYEELFGVNVLDYINVERRRDNYMKLISFLNVVQDLAGLVDGIYRLEDVYLHPISRINETMLGVGMCFGDVRLRVDLVLVEPNKYRVDVLRNGVMKSFYSASLFESIDLIKRVISGNVSLE